MVARIAALLLAGWFSATSAYAQPQRTFKTPEEAVQTLVEAARTVDAAALMAIFGPAGKEIIASGDDAADRQQYDRFAAAAGEAVVLNRDTPDRFVLGVGRDHWPFPIPIVKRIDGWVFDTDAGREEILNRRIGRNELRAIEVCQSYVSAQREYGSVPRDGDAVITFAGQIISDPGRHNGLYWEVVDDETPSPLGPLMAAAAREGRPPRKPDAPPAPFHGYYYRILTAQGANAPGGAYSYVINGNMVAGFALVAWPAAYGSSGIMTFIVNQNGVVYEKDLGRKTAEIAGKITRYDPDQSWRRAQ